MRAPAVRPRRGDLRPRPPAGRLLRGEGGGTDADGTIRLSFQSLAWQKESVDANKQLVREWNAAHPDVQVDYVQGSWDNVHDQLLTSFEGGEAPDIIHDASDDLADFAYGGYLADLRTLLPDRLTEDIPQQSWATTTFGDGVYGVPFLQEPRVLIANKKILASSGVRIPTPDKPWSWEEFRQVTEKLTKKGTYGVAWPLKEPVSVTLNLGLSAGGQLFHRGADGKVAIRSDEGDQVMPGTVRDQVNTDRSAARSALGMGGSDTLPGFFGGKYAMVPLGLLLPPAGRRAGPRGLRMDGAARPGRQRRARPGGQPADPLGRRGQPAQEGGRAVHRLPAAPAEHGAAAPGATGCCRPAREALADPALHTEENGWATGAALARSLRPAPAQSVRGYPEWKDKVATPRSRSTTAGPSTPRS